MSGLFLAAELLLGLLFHALLALALLAVLLGPRRTQDRIYGALKAVVWLPLSLAAVVLPRADKPSLLRIGSALAAFVAWFALLPKLTLTLARAQWLDHIPLATLLLLVVLFGLGQALPATWLRPWVRGLVAVALVEFVHLGLYALFRAQGWLPGAA
ncbi:hypothetical protein [Rehaibacterium terrae]|jgi:hypothetical protein|uniref:MFS superfamily sulfate permease-like transporter n=1 Tax=Rehaibacterium terrae TaxID=1341696 RepID=A0A7W7V6R7_9GAMM|nr:hypothetical protein [Rehaibacterium terrae]MBB5014177.1 MFS superfamily sulfate permease-like transporter [Rehaibacterium terrae]